jgi:hypothetical protein
MTSPIGSGLVRLFLKISRHLQTGDPAATIDRLFDSKHVKDLQLIVAVALAILALVFSLGLPFFVGNELVSPTSDTVQLVVEDERVSAVPSSTDGCRVPERSPSSAWGFCLCSRGDGRGDLQVHPFLCLCSALWARLSPGPTSPAAHASA